ncbi:MAG: hypothetical protein JWO31_1530 [Phycisphaerales bacterium]|nr:hypothetical protein [Phycisphaerales bacterium]
MRPQCCAYGDRYAAYDEPRPAGSRHPRTDQGEAQGNGRTHTNGVENFWRFAGRPLKLYRGGWKRNFRLFVREMEFRLNDRHDVDPAGRLRKPRESR